MNANDILDPAANDNRRDMEDAGALEGVRVLVVEDDPLLLMDLEALLLSAGAIVVGLCQTLGEALALSEQADFSVAVLDFRLGSETASPVARRLSHRGVPFVFYTAQGRQEPAIADWQDSLIVEKPSPPKVLLSAVRAALAR
jgi:DNA-binding response OmpR family regulator